MTSTYMLELLTSVIIRARKKCSFYLKLNTVQCNNAMYRIRIRNCIQHYMCYNSQYLMTIFYKDMYCNKHMLCLGDCPKTFSR